MLSSFTWTSVENTQFIHLEFLFTEVPLQYLKLFVATRYFTLPLVGEQFISLNSAAPI